MELTSKGVNKQFIDLHLVIIASGKKKTTISIPFAPVQRRVFGCFFFTKHPLSARVPEWHFNLSSRGGNINWFLKIANKQNPLLSRGVELLIARK